MIVYKQYTERKQIFQLGKAYSNNIRWDNIFFPPKFRKNLNHRKHISVATLLKCPAVARQQILKVFTFKHYLDGLAKSLFWGLQHEYILLAICVNIHIVQWTLGGVWAKYTVRKVLADSTVLDWWRYCKALCDAKFRQLEGNGRKFRPIASSVKFVLIEWAHGGLTSYMGPKVNAGQTVLATPCSL